MMNNPTAGFRPEWLYEDREILVLNKPAGLTCHGGPGISEETLTDILQTTYPHFTQNFPNSERPGLVHRLDKQTSGLMVVAKTQPAYDHLVTQFKNRSVQKKYYAVVQGAVAWEALDIDRPIGRDKTMRHKMTAHPQRQINPKSAKTALTLIAKTTTTSLLEVHPETGRTHQIRVHLASVGHAVLGDPLYGPKKNRGQRQQLQAFYLQFDHPAHDLRISFTLSYALDKWF